MLFEEMAARAGHEPRQVLYTVPEVAEILGVPQRTLYDEIEAGRLAEVHLVHRPKPKYLEPEELNRWLREEWSR